MTTSTLPNAIEPFSDASAPKPRSISDLPLFYRSVVPLDRNVHRACRLAQPQRFGFARMSHLVPALIDEIGAACRHLPVIFLPESTGPVPVFLVGTAPGACALIDAEGAWRGRYLPAYLRRYPFIMGEGAGPEPLVCFDAESDLLRHPSEEAPVQEEPDGAMALFAEDGSETSLLQERIRLVADYAAAAQRSAAFGRVLQELNLLRAITVRLQHPATGESHTLHGMLGVDEASLAALPQADLARLHTEGWLGTIYAHLISLQTIADFLVLTPATAVTQLDLKSAATTGNA